MKHLISVPSRFNSFRQILPVILVCFLLWSCGEEGGSLTGNSVFRYNEAAGISSLDPAFARDQATIWAVHQIFNGLVQLNSRLEPQPCIARNWEINKGGTEYLFHLRRDVKFHDDGCFAGGLGRMVVASDFVYSFSRLNDPKIASPGSWIFNEVEKDNGFLAPDDSTFIIRLKQPFPPFIGLLSTQYCCVVPREACERYGPDFRKYPVGTGPFLFKLWKEGVKLVLVKNPSYFERDYQGNRLPYLDAVSVTFLADRQAAFLEFVKGRLDFISGIDPTYKDELLNRDGSLRLKYRDRFSMMTQPYLNTEYLAFQVDKQLQLSQTQGVVPQKVRQAFNYAFDRGKMIRFLRNNIGTPGYGGIIPEGMPSYDTNYRYYSYDPARARRLLAEAGYPEGQGLPPITLTTTPDYLDICKYIQYQVGEVGIDLKIDISPPAAMKEMKAQCKLPFFRASWIADYPDGENYLSLFYSKNFAPGGPNYTHFSDPRFDLLYEKAMATVDDSVRNQLYRQMEGIMMEASPVVILYYDRVLRFVRNEVTGLEGDPMNLLTLKTVRKKAEK